MSARAVARLGPGFYCVYALKTTSNPLAPSGKQATASFNSSTFNSPTCGIISNGGLYVEDSTVTTDAIGYAGAFQDNGGRYALARPLPAMPVTDPCQTIAGCAYLTNSPPTTSPCTPYNGAATLNPGVYCSLPINRDTTFNPGLYVVNGDFTSNGWSMTGNGVTFYMSGGKININSANGGQGLNLNAPTTGNYTGVLFYQPATNTNQAYFESSHGGSGALYFPNAFLHFNSDTTQWFPVIAGWIYMEQWSSTIAGNSAGAAQRAILAE